MKKWGIILVLFTSEILFLALFNYVNDGRAAVYSNGEVSFIDVGQGNSALIRDSNNFDVLIDEGKTSAGPTVVAYLRAQGVDDIDVMVASHADSDHVGGLIYHRNSEHQ